MTASGKILPEKQVEISANISALIMEISVEEGDSVMMGQHLISLDRMRYEAASEQAHSRLKSAEAKRAAWTMFTPKMCLSLASFTSRRCGPTNQRSTVTSTLLISMNGDLHGRALASESATCRFMKSAHRDLHDRPSAFA